MIILLHTDYGFDLTCSAEGPGDWKAEVAATLGNRKAILIARNSVWW